MSGPNEMRGCVFYTAYSGKDLCDQAVAIYTSCLVMKIGEFDRVSILFHRKRYI